VLEQIVRTVRAFAGYYAPGKDPYDTWLGEFERGLDQKKADAFFEHVKAKIVPLIHKIADAGQPGAGFLTGSFPLEKQRALSDYLMELLCIDRTHCGIGETEHPFTLNFNKYDVRITTKYHPDNFASSMYSVIHEGGHALYELGTGDELAYTCLASGVSMGVHESQSRLYENMIGRSREFIGFVRPKLAGLFPDALGGVSAEALYRAVNRSEPSLIRTEADELTYPLHVIVRYEIEKLLMADQVQVNDLPGLWAELMKDYLGVDVPDDRRGVLQDSHWSGGSIGYFPSYAIGSAYSAQIMDRMRRDIDVYGGAAKGNLRPVVDWLTQNIYRYGSLYDPEELLARCCGQPFDPSYYTDYLVGKYSALYSV